MKKIFILIFLISGMTQTMAQESIGIEMELIVTQITEKGVELKATLTDEENSEPVAGVSVNYSVTINDQLIDLGKATTNHLGVAELKGIKLEDLRKLGHFFVFTASFEGDTKFSAGDTTIEIKDAIVAVSNETVDSVNMVFVKLTTWNEDGEVIPVAETDLKIYVPRMFSLLPIADVTTDEEGVGELEFPSDIPGGKNGELTIIARMEEHEEFGNVESAVQTTWGVKHIQDAKLHRALWSPDAPVWMVITFAILMTGVWFHYLLIVYLLARIKRSGGEGELDYSE